MRKIMSVFLIVVLLFLNSTTVFAYNSVPSVICGEDTYISYEDYLYSQQKIEEYYQNGLDVLNAININSRGTPTTTSKSLNVIQILQNDSRWGNTYMPCGCGKYKDIGCAMTAYAMAINYKSGTSYTPVNIAQNYFNSYGDPCGFNSASLVGQYAGRSRVLTSGLTSGSYSYVQTIIIGAIDAGHPVVAKLARADGSNHFIVCDGYTSSSAGYVSIYIEDAYESSTYSYSTLNQYINEGTYVVSLSVIQ